MRMRYAAPRGGNSWSQVFPKAGASRKAAFMLRPLTLCLLAFAPPLQAAAPRPLTANTRSNVEIRQDPEAAATDPAAALRAWLADYKSGAIRFQKEGVTDSDVIAALEQQLAAVAARNTFSDAQLLFELRKKMTPEAYEEEKSRSRSFFAATFRPANAVILRGVPFRP